MGLSPSLEDLRGETGVPRKEGVLQVPQGRAHSVVHVACDPQSRLRAIGRDQGTTEACRALEAQPRKKRPIAILSLFD